MSELIATRIRGHALRLGLTHLADTATQLAARAEADSLGYLDLIDLVLEEELGLRKGRRSRNVLKLSGDLDTAVPLTGTSRGSVQAAETVRD